MNATSCLRPTLIDVLAWIGRQKPANEPIRVLDAPCGDLEWMPTLWQERAGHGRNGEPLRRIEYTGMDIVQPLIDGHQQWAAKAATTARLARLRVSVKFEQHDVVAEPLRRSYDLIHTKDMMIHLTNSDVMAVLKTFAASGSRWLMATTGPRLFTAAWHHPEWPATARQNYELGVSKDMERMQPAAGAYQQHGNGRDVDLERPPYSLPRPLCRSMQFPPMRAQMNLWDLRALADHLNVTRRHARRDRVGQV